VGAKAGSLQKLRDLLEPSSSYLQKREKKISGCGSQNAVHCHMEDLHWRPPQATSLAAAEPDKLRVPPCICSREIGESLGDVLLPALADVHGVGPTEGRHRAQELKRKQERKDEERPSGKGGLIRREEG
jgi:hypothetical protein